MLTFCRSEWKSFPLYRGKDFARRVPTDWMHVADLEASAWVCMPIAIWKIHFLRGSRDSTLQPHSQYISGNVLLKSKVIHTVSVCHSRIGHSTMHTSARVRSAANTHVWPWGAVQREWWSTPFLAVLYTVLHHVWRCPAQKSRLATGWMMHLGTVNTEHVKPGVCVFIR